MCIRRDKGSKAERKVPREKQKKEKRRGVLHPDQGDKNEFDAPLNQQFRAERNALKPTGNRLGLYRKGLEGATSGSVNGGLVYSKKPHGSPKDPKPGNRNEQKGSGDLPSESRARGRISRS